MKLIYKIHFVLFFLLTASSINAQWGVRTTAGTSCYLGDLITNQYPLFKQASPSFSTSQIYNITDQMRARMDESFMWLKGDDQYAPDQYRKARNLNFKSFVWEVSTMMEYDILPKDQYNIVPYAFTGFGVAHYDPYTFDSIAGKVYLRDVGTSGQYLGVPGYPEPYHKTTVVIPCGIGLRYEVSESFTMSFEFNYRITFTDWLDDVSSANYVNPSLFYTSSYYTANNNYYADLASRLGFRSTDPIYHLSYPRGNPNKKDAFYSFQVSASFSLDELLGGGTQFSGSSYRSSRHYTY